MKIKLLVLSIIAVSTILFWYIYKNNMSNSNKYISSEANKINTAPTPGDTFKLDSVQLRQLHLEAQSGKIDAMKKLAIYYGVHVSDDKLASYWYERAAFAGDHEFRAGIVSKLLSSDSKIDNNRGKQLKQQWNIKDEN